MASAYSLFDYRIADDLGGEAAYINLRDRAYHHGIRLASDMVPNHMGIDSPWVIEHPEWFISRRDPPYPAYSFNGPDLSHDGRVEIKIEDHYYEQSDAAVVFRRRDKATGETRYIYHGNDGTSFPWNDTAQLDYLNPAVREQVIQTILHVARLFPVIRFDAAMTLAKRHFHRLWFPGPGSSGAIPSRAEYGMSQAEFDRAMPHEFWREVVDRVAAEVPGTLLLAEAFWLMEGYFVRTLGMHRVYNSAFMIMLRDEDNAKYRSVIKNTLEFDPDIMKRYVNFMSNPDERTAIDQFGKGDKCFGVAAMMATLPGLPMFGHGQIEGFTEKYGMEYRGRATTRIPNAGWSSATSARSRRCSSAAGSLPRAATSCSTTSSAATARWTKTSSPTPTATAASARWSSTTTATANAHGTIDFSAAYADKGSGQLRQQRLREGLGLSGDCGARSRLARLAHRPGIPAPRRRSARARPHPRSARLPVPRLPRLARAASDRRSSPGTGSAISSTGAACPTWKTRWSIWNCSPCTMRCGSCLIRHGAPSSPIWPSIRAPSAQCEAQKTRAGAQRISSSRPGRAARTSCARRRRPMPCGSAESQPALGTQPADPASLARRPSASVCAPPCAFLESRRSSRLPGPRLPAACCPAPARNSPRRPCGARCSAGACWSCWPNRSMQKQPERIALDLFDRLRLREPFARPLPRSDSRAKRRWRVAARIKVLLLTGAGIGKRQESAPAVR